MANYTKNGALLSSVKLRKHIPTVYELERMQEEADRIETQAKEAQQQEEATPAVVRDLNSSPEEVESSPLPPIPPKMPIPSTEALDEETAFPTRMDA